MAVFQSTYLPLEEEAKEMIFEVPRVSRSSWSTRLKFWVSIGSAPVSLSADTVGYSQSMSTPSSLCLSMSSFTDWQKAVRLASFLAISENPSAWPPQPPIISMTFSLGFTLLRATTFERGACLDSVMTMPPSPVLGFLKRPWA